MVLPRKRSPVSDFLYKLNPFKSGKMSKALIHSNHNPTNVEVKPEKNEKALNINSKDNSSLDDLKLKQWPWLISFLCSKSYCDDCPKHDIPLKDCRLNYFCIDCPHAGPLCIACIEEDHKDHKFVKVSRYANTTVVKESQAHCIDSSKVYPYMLRGEAAYFLTSDRPSNAVKRCVVCERVLGSRKIKTWWNMESKKKKRLEKIQNDRKDAIYCSLLCKMKDVLGASGKPPLKSIRVHNDDHGGAISWEERFRIEEDRKHITWESECDNNQISDEIQPTISSNTEERNDQDMKNVKGEKNEEPCNIYDIHIKHIDNHEDLNNPDQNVFGNGDVDGDINNAEAKIDFDVVHISGDMASSTQAFSDEDEGDDNDDVDDDNVDEILSSPTQTVADVDVDETMSSPTKTVNGNVVDETLRSPKYESPRDDAGTSDGDRYDDGVGGDEVEDDTDQDSDYELTDDYLTDHDEKLFEDNVDHNSPLKDELELLDEELLSEREPWASNQCSDEETDLMYSDQLSSENNEETDNTQSNNNTNSSIVMSTEENNKETTIEIDLIQHDAVKIEVPKHGDENQEKCHIANQEADHFVFEGYEVEHIVFEDHEGNDNGKIDYIVAENNEEIKFKKDNDNEKINHIVAKYNEENKVNEDCDIEKIDHIIAEHKEENKVNEDGDNEKIDYNETEHNEENKAGEDNEKINYIGAECNEEKKARPEDKEENKANDVDDKDKVEQTAVEKIEENKGNEDNDNDKVDHIVAQATEVNKVKEDNDSGKDEKLHRCELSVLTDCISSSVKKAVSVLSKAKTTSGHVHQRKRPERDGVQEDQNEYKYEAHHLNHDLFHGLQFDRNDAKKDNQNINGKHEKLRFDVEVQTDTTDTCSVSNVQEYNTSWKRLRMSNSSPKPIASVTIDIYNPRKRS